MKRSALTNLSQSAKVLGLALALVILQGCSTIKLGYNNAPTLVYWWIDGYMDVSDQQGPVIRAEIARLHQWHRTAELPKIEALLQRSEVMLASDVTSAQICTELNEMRARVNSVRQRAIGSAASIAATITPAQREHIARKFEKDNAKWQEEWRDGSVEERRKKRIEVGVENAEQLYGSLNDKQVALISELDTVSAYDPDIALKERLRRQQDLLQTLARINPPNPADKPSEAQAIALLQGVLARYTSSPDPTYRTFAEKMYTESCNAFAVVHNSVTPKQRERALKSLAAYASDARELMGVKESK